MDEQKAAVGMAEMARRVGLSRARFYQLVGSTFPYPVYDVATRRPFYDAELQQVCMEVRRRNCGIDGRQVLFYAKRQGTGPSRPKRPRNGPPPTAGRHDDLLEGLRSLGMAEATASQVQAALKASYPDGVKGLDKGEVLRGVFLCLKRRDSRVNLAR
jgi:hypothetical protein